MAFGLTELGLNPPGEIRRNPSLEVLVEATIARDGGMLGPGGSVMIDTGIYTGRSPLDRYIVDEPSSTDNIW